MFIHLVRILHAEGGGKIQELNRRYVFVLAFNASTAHNRLGSFRSMPTFGRDTIRKFSNNVSATTHFAGRDFEDVLQVRVSWLSTHLISAIKCYSL